MCRGFSRWCPRCGAHHWPPALPVGLEGDRFQALRDQDLLPGVLAVPIGVDPVLPLAPVVLGDFGDGAYPS